MLRKSDIQDPLNKTEQRRSNLQSQYNYDLVAGEFASVIESQDRKYKSHVISQPDSPDLEKNPFSGQMSRQPLQENQFQQSKTSDKQTKLPKDTGYIDASFFEEEDEIRRNAGSSGEQQWQDFLDLQKKVREQPELHQENKTLCLKLFPKLAQKTNLDEDELQTYYQLRFQYIVSYDAKKEDHETALQRLAFSLLHAGKVSYAISAQMKKDSQLEESIVVHEVQFGQESKTATGIGKVGKRDFYQYFISAEDEEAVAKDLTTKGLKHVFWRRFGFQQNDPRTDFRAAGLLGLTQLDYFAKKYPRELFQATTIDCEWFFLALFSIRISHTLVVLFHLMSPQDRRSLPPKMRSIKVKRASFKNFVRLSAVMQFQTEQALDELKSPVLALNEVHAQALMFLIEVWKRLYATVTTTNQQKNQTKSKKVIGPPSIGGAGVQINIEELSELSEKAHSLTVKFIQKITAVRMDCLDDLVDQADVVKEQMLTKLQK